MYQRRSAFFLGALVAAVASPQWAAASEFDVLINEINYHPFTGDDRDEFVELYNRGPAPIDLGGWRFTEGITFTFPAGTSIGPYEYLVVSPDSVHSQLHYHLANVVGNYTGKLDNNGEILALSNAQGALISRVHFLDGQVWPSPPDGRGPSLELATPHEQNDQPQKWASSLVLEGTPGVRNSRFTEARAPRTVLESGAVYRYFRGLAEPSTGTLWANRGFNASSWTQGPGPFGYGDAYPHQTTLDDMRGGYTTFYIRGLFDLDSTTLAELRAKTLGLTLHLTYDDGCVVYLNGTEVGRANLLGSPPSRSAVTENAIDNGSLSLSLDPDLLQTTGNVLAVQGANSSLSNSSDFFLSSELIVSTPAFSAAEVGRTVVLNEVRPAESGNGFIELYNATGSTVDVGGWFIVDSRNARYQLPAPSAIPSLGWLSIGEAQLGFPPALAGARYALVKQDGLTWVDGLEPRSGGANQSFGRFPDGDGDQYLLTSPSGGNRNQLTLETGVVLNEILFHPPFVAPSGPCTRQCSDPDQWIEIINRGAQEVNLAGWSISRAVEFTFPANLKLPAGGYLVVAADRARFLARYPGVDPGRVVGNWTQSLSRASDTINLRDALGNRVDHVNYGDGTPQNDEEPIDGINDRTIISSEWPAGADSVLGRTLELIHPSLDNRAGASWALGPAGGTPAAPNSVFDATPPPVVWEVEHSPVVPRSSEAVRVSCRVSSLTTVSKVECLWHLEPAGATVTLPLLDNGLSGDGAAGDGVYGGSLPAQANGAVVGFRVRAQAQDAQTALVPRSPAVAPYTGFNGNFFLYQVADAPPPTNGSVTYRVVMTAADLNELRTRPVESDVLLPCTFIGDGQAFHTVGIRIRGENTRNSARKPWRIDFPPERRFRGMEHLNLVSVNIQNEILASDLFRRAGLPYLQEWTVNLIFQGSLDPLYLVKENMDGDFLDRFFGGSSGGNLYRARESEDGPETGDLIYHGPSSPIYEAVYDKRSNREENDYSDLIELCRAFDPVETPNDVFPERIAELIDVDEWARFFAIQAALSNVDGAIETNVGEDYLLYRVPAASARPDRGRWLITPWDLDETFRNSTERLFRPSVGAIRRFLTHPAFAPLYYANLTDLRNGAFSRAEIRQRFTLIDDLFGFGTIDGIDSYLTARIGFFDENVPIALSAGVSGVTTKLVSPGDTWRYWKGTAEPSGGNRSWSNRTFNDSGWLQGPSGIGYADGDDTTMLPDMEGGYTTYYCRKTFPVQNPASISSLQLNISYDDGFVAYLNGTEVARRNAPGNPGTFVAFNAEAPDEHEAGVAETIDLTAQKNVLVSGDNVLAIQALNTDVDSSDASLIPELLSAGAISGAGCGTILYATGSPVTLGGRSHAGDTRSVKVNGAAAQYDPYTARWSASVNVALGDNTVRVEAFDAGGDPLDTLDLQVIRISGAFTNVGGTLPANAVWTAAGGPYLMTQNVIVPAGVKLTIQPGVYILGQPGASLIVRGHLEAIGTREEPILFRAQNCQSPMGGIALDNTGTGATAPQHRLKYCDLQFLDSPAGFNGTVAPVNSKLLVEDSTFRDLTANGIEVTTARLQVERCLFERIHEGVHGISSTVIILDSTFSHLVGDSDAIDFDLNGSERSRIERCVLEYSSDDGIDLADTTVDIRDNILRFISDKAISLESNGPLGPPTVTGNLIHDSGTAIALNDGVTITQCHHNTLVGNQEGLNLFAKAGAPDGGHGVFHSMIVWDNLFDVKLDQRSSASFTFSDLGAPWPGTGNISDDPRFEDLLGKDYSLVQGSPAIGTGQSGTDMGAIPFSGSPVLFIRGDGNSSGTVNVSDAVFSLEYLFRAGNGPACLDRLDANDDGEIDISDPLGILLHLFAQGVTLRPPFPAEGSDPTPDSLTCR